MERLIIVVSHRSMNGSWMCGDMATMSCVNSLEGFLRTIIKNMERKGNKVMCCPCHKCGNLKMLSKKGELQLHLLTKGLTEGYTRWTCHSGEAECNIPKF